MLEFEHRYPEGAQNGAPLIVALHGRGSDKSDLISLAPYFPETAMVVTPRAPFPGAPWGYGDGWAWYQFLGGTTPEPQSFVAGQNALAEFMSELPRQLPVEPGPIIMGGFSQGSSTSLAYAVRNPGSVLGVFVLSGLVVSHPSMDAGLTNARGLPVFWGHGTHDVIIPFETAQAGRARLRAEGIDLTTRDYGMAHSIDAIEIADLRGWMDKLLAK
jgi:phospholipase/carboxylesterase